LLSLAAKVVPSKLNNASPLATNVTTGAPSYAFVTPLISKYTICLVTSKATLPPTATVFGAVGANLIPTTS
jgi:hypothetical protein